MRERGITTRDRRSDAVASHRHDTPQRWLWRSRWAAIGAAIAVTIGGGGFFVAHAASSPPSTVVTIAPVRILDTRDPLDVGLAGPFASQVSQKLRVTGAVPTTTGTQTPVPVGATGVLLNVTVVGATAAGFVSIRPGDATGLPSTSSLNFGAGDIVPNSVQVGLPTSGPAAGTIDITYDAFGVAGPATDLLIDVVGYTTELDAYTRAQTDAAIDAAAQRVVAQIGDAQQTIAAGGVGAGFTFPAAQLTQGDTTITTARAGHLEFGFIGAGGLTCTTASTYYAWIEIDVGSPATPNYVPVRSSVVVVGENFSVPGADTLSATNVSQKVLQGVTATPIPAGTHRIRTRYACTSGASGAAASAQNFSWVVKVLPGNPSVGALELLSTDDPAATACIVDEAGLETCR
jgi:hypothetical protein